MVKLTDLPNELLLCIMAELSPLYIDSFVLICKHFYYLGIDTVQAQNLARSKLPSCVLGSDPADLLRSIIQDPDTTVYPLSCSFLTLDRGSPHATFPLDLFTEINLQVAQSPHPGFPTVIDTGTKAADMIIPLLITRLQNLRRLRLFGFCGRYLLNTISCIVEASHHMSRSINEPLALGRLTEVNINARKEKIDSLHLTVLLSMIPTVRRLNASRLVHEEPYSFPYPLHSSSVTNLCLDGCVDPSFVKALITITHNLQSFHFTCLTENLTQDIVFRRLPEILLEHVGASLLHLSLLTEDCENCVHGLCVRSPRKYADLFLGSLRRFHNLKTLTTGVEMFIRTHDFDSCGIGTGMVQRLDLCLPASLEALVLHKRLDKRDKDILDKIFRGLRDKKQARLAKLKLIDFVDFSDFGQVMPGIFKVTCRELGIKIGYTLNRRQKLHERQVLQQLRMFEELPWIAVLGKCYQQKGCSHCEWVAA